MNNVNPKIIVHLMDTYLKRIQPETIEDFEQWRDICIASIHKASKISNEILEGNAKSIPEDLYARWKDSIEFNKELLEAYEQAIG